jgi:hypothetical protein
MKPPTNTRIITSLAFTIPFTLLFLVACGWWLEAEEREIDEANITVAANAEATEQALATAKAEATSAAPATTEAEATGQAAEATPDSTPVPVEAVGCETEAECINEGVHNFTVVTQGGGGVTQEARYTITFTPGGVSMQANENPAAHYVKLEDGQYQFTVSNGDSNILTFNLEGFIVEQTKPDGSVFTWVFTRVGG